MSPDRRTRAVSVLTGRRHQGLRPQSTGVGGLVLKDWEPT